MTVRLPILGASRLPDVTRASSPCAVAGASENARPRTFPASHARAGSPCHVGATAPASSAADALPAHGGVGTHGGGVADFVRWIGAATREGVDNFANAFPPHRTPVPQPADPGDTRQVMGFFTDTTLCIGCKACEVACKQWNQLPSEDRGGLSGYSYDNTRHLGATAWRHVKFKEKLDEHPDGTTTSRWLMLSDVCKHCQSAPCQHACPTGAIVYNDFGDVYVQSDICNGCGYCVIACPFGVLGRADDPFDDGHAHKCTLCMDRQRGDLTPACAKSCPTASIQFGPVEELRAAAKQRVADLHERGNDQAYLYGVDSVGDYGPLNAFFLLQDHPNEYNLPVNPPQPFRGQGKRYAASLGVGVALAGIAAMIFGRSGRRR